MSTQCGALVPTATLYQTRTTVLPTRIVATIPGVGDDSPTTTTITSSFTSTLQLPTDTLFSTPLCAASPTSTSAASNSSSSQQRASSTTQTLTSALATVSDARGAPSVVYVTYTQTRSSIPPVTVIVAPTASATSAAPQATADSQSKHSSKTGVIAGAAVGALAAIILLAVAIIFALKRRRSSKSNETLDDLFQRSTGGQLMVQSAPTRGNSHHSTITKSYLKNSDDDEEAGTPTATLPHLDHSALAHPPPMSPTWPLHVNTTYDNGQPFTATPIDGSRPSPYTPPDASVNVNPSASQSPAPRLDRSASAKSEIHRLSNPNLLAAMDIRPMSSMAAHDGSHNSSGNSSAIATPSDSSEPSPNGNQIAARPSSVAGQIRSTPSSPTYPSHAPLFSPHSPRQDHATAWYGAPHPRVASPPPRMASPPAMRPRSIANDPTYPSRTMSPPPLQSQSHSQFHSNSQAPHRKIHRNRTLSAGSLSTILSQQGSDGAGLNRPSSPLAANSFGIQPVPHSYTHSSLPQRRSTASPPPLGSYSGDWPPSRYGHLDIGRRLSVAREEQTSDGKEPLPTTTTDSAPAAASTSTATPMMPTTAAATLDDYHRSLAAKHHQQAADVAHRPRESFWRSNLHGSSHSVYEPAEDEQESKAAAAAAERKLWGNHNLFVLNADAEQDDE